MRTHSVSPLFAYRTTELVEDVIVLSGTDITTLTLLVMNRRNLTGTFIKDGVVLHKFEDPSTVARLRFDLSFDGTKLAVGVEDFTKRVYQVYINGNLTYEVPFGREYDFEEKRISDLNWISNTELMWTIEEYEHTRGPSLQTRDDVFLNGEWVTGKLDCQRFFPTPDGDLDLIVGDFENRKWWKVNRLGAAYDHQRLPEDVHYPMMLSDLWAAESRFERPETVGTPEGWAVKYGEKTSPTFDGIGFGCQGQATLSHNRQHVGYVGMRIGAAPKMVMSKFSAVVYFHDKYEDHPLLAPLAKLAGGIAVLAINPYTGPLYAWYENSRTYYPASLDGGVWKTGYAGVYDQFFTPTGEMVVRAKKRFTVECLVIDQEEGPEFNRVYQALYLPDSNTLSYIGRRGDTFYRVVVTQQTP